ncbi:hypothetical protein MIND_00525600 [Mycena indigotica]|uniref:Uncharacterized protein n=1 Tax=Mycena indigotica TaxID=2126181 RepID=A0A8H6SZ51_9AGAR|nr:uncharacterized protein MIND_00525600 [Mycena indigotica]KAF7307316.1 hypothetical protein MIND_00525600 [Mycena indigotica]
MDTDLGRIYQIVHELSEQLAQNQKTTAALQSQATALKGQAEQSGSGFALRRFNTDIANETFESELERMNAHIVIENQTLLHENKQLSILLKEYEGTLETVMAKFRNHALASQQYELNLTRHYEALLLTRETQTLSHDLASSSEITHSVQRIAHLLRATLQVMAGEDPDPELEYEAGEYIDPNELLSLVDALDNPEDWAVEREAEISRLEQENAALRRMLGIDPETLEANGVSVEVDREPARYALMLSRRRSASGDGPRMSYWDNGQAQQQQTQQQQQQQQQQQMQQQQQQQRAMDMQPMMRAGQANRRPGMFGAGAGRGVIPGAMGAPPQGPMWNPPPTWQPPPEFSR